MRSSIAALLCLIALPASAQTLRQEVYEGTIGKSPVVLQILTWKDANATAQSGEYFYSKFRTPITLAPGKAPLTFTETDPNCYDTTCPVTGTLALKNTAGALSGTWQAPGKPARLTVAFKRVAAHDYTLPPQSTSDEPTLLWDEDAAAQAGGNPYLQRLYDNDLVNGAETRSNGVSYRAVTHKGTGVSYLRLTGHPDPAAMKAVNARLDVRRYEYQSGALYCAGMLKENNQGPGYGGYEDTNVQATYVTPTLFFVEESGSTYCGGAHPNNFWTITGYDLKTGQRLDMNRLLKIHDPAPGSDSSESPQYKALLAKLKPSSPWFVAGAEIPECLAEDLGYGYSLSFNAKGLVFSLTDLPHVMGACMGEYYVVPYAELKTLWRPEAKAYFAEAR